MKTLVQALLLVGLVVLAAWALSGIFASSNANPANPITSALGGKK